MICRLCCDDKENVVPIFESDQEKMKVANIINKHFQFEPKCDDPVSTVICDNCLHTLLKFHKFYINIKSNQQRVLSERSLTQECCNNELNKDQAMSTNPHQDLELELNSLASPESFKLPENAQTMELEYLNHFNILNANEDLEQDKNNELSLVSSQNICIEDESGEHKNSVSKIDSVPGNNNSLYNDVQIDEQKINDLLINVDNMEPDLEEAAFIDSIESIELFDSKDELHKILDNFLTDQDIGLEASQPRVDEDQEHSFKNNDPSIQEKLNGDLIKYFINYEMCNEKDNSSSFLRNFMQNKHGMQGYMHRNKEDKTFNCLYCFKKFRAKYSLHQHIVASHKDHTVPCSICKKRFVSTKNLRKHLRSYYHKDAIYDEYGKVVEAKKPTNVESGSQILHFQEKPYKCSLCSKRFKKPIFLKKHVAKHNADFNYLYPSCSKYF